MRALIGFLQLLALGFLMLGCVHYCNRTRPPCPDPPPVENTCDCECDCKEDIPTEHHYNVTMPEETCGPVICCDGCGREDNGTIFCK